MSHYVYHNLQATEISKLQLIIALYVIYIWLIGVVFILTSYALSSLRLDHFMMKKTDMTYFCFMINKYMKDRKL